tara:strand:+ start:902 stop:1441 length:540 start_codon:yes stop_codon:yes gene_type:complete
MGSSPIYLGEMPSVSFADAIKIAFSKYADFRGRARRSEYWWFFLFVQLVTQLPGIILPGVGSIVSLVAFLVTFIPSLSVTARRLHDIGRTGWWQLSWFLLGFLSAVMVIIGSLGAIVVFFDEFAIDNGLEQFDHGFEAFVGIGVLGLLISLATLLWWIIWLVKKGDLGSNEYGSDPRSR